MSSSNVVHQMKDVLHAIDKSNRMPASNVVHQMKDVLHAIDKSNRMPASNVVHQMKGVLNELKTSITPQITQFKENPNVRLTYEEYINQELSMFRKIVTENKINK